MEKDKGEARECLDMKSKYGRECDKVRLCFYVNY